MKIHFLLTKCILCPLFHSLPRPPSSLPRPPPSLPSLSLSLQVRHSDPGFLPWLSIGGPSICSRCRWRARVAWSARGGQTDAGSGSVTAKNALIERGKISPDRTDGSWQRLPHLSWAQHVGRRRGVLRRRGAVEVVAKLAETGGGGQGQGGAGGGSAGCGEAAAVGQGGLVGQGRACRGGREKGVKMMHFLLPSKFTFCPQPIFYPLFLNKDGRFDKNSISKLLYRF